MSDLIRPEYEDVLKELEYRRDAWKSLAEVVAEKGPALSRAIAEKIDKDISALFNEEEYV